MIVWGVGVGIIAWVRRRVSGWGNLDCFSSLSVSLCGCGCGCSCGCECVGVICGWVWVGVGVIVWARKEVGGIALIVVAVAVIVHALFVVACRHLNVAVGALKFLSSMLLRCSHGGSQAM